ncbi:MAG: RNA methyltransferase [Ignisphaera sp.]
MNDLMKPLRTPPLMTFSIPSSLISDAFDDREKARKIGYIGRAAAIFRIEEIMIYVDDSKDKAEYINALLQYLETPPYLRKKLIRINPKLKFAGILPPLKSAHHVPESFGSNIREGVVISSNGIKSVIDVGLKKHVIVYTHLPIGKRVTVALKKEFNNNYIGALVDKDNIELYWGFATKLFEDIRDLLQFLKSHGYLIICASKKGKMIYNIENILSEELKMYSKLNVVFGGPKLDVDEIAQKSGINIDDYCNHIVNFVPRQGVESIRTEEAILIVLAILNYLKEKPKT